jgi:hypothetical protein
MLSGERLSCFTSSSSHVSSSGYSFHILRRCLVWKLNGSPSVLPFAAWLSNIPSGLAHSLLKPVALRSALSTNGACRFREADPTDLQVLFSRSRARHTPPAPPDLRLVQRIFEIRTAPPENLQRTPGPRTILYYLKRDADLQAQGLVPPTSTRTIWKILHKLGFILDPSEHTRKPLESREPLQEIQMDFKDATTVPADPEGKRQHVVEVLNFVDAGTSILRKSRKLMPIFMPKQPWMPL